MTDHDHATETDAPDGRLDDPSTIRDFTLAGNATLTLVSKRTGARFTYRVRSVPDAADGRRPGPVSHFVHVLTNPDNENGYSYLGNVYTRGDVVDYGHGRKSKVGSDAPSARAFAWFFGKVVAGDATPEGAALEVWHSGACGRCGRKLTVPESIRSGIGPECAARMAGG